MPAQWLNSSSDVMRRIPAALENGLYTLARPEPALRLRQGLTGLLLLWSLLALVQLVWSLVPAPEGALPEGGVIINPVFESSPSQQARVVDIDRLAGWHLFGEAGAQAPPGPEAVPALAGAQALEGIEKGASETRLSLRLVGVVASSREGLGHAIIEHQKKQAVYAVDDTLPVQGRVTLAKVMPTQVVLDNGGTYELLKLFDRDGLGKQLGSVPAPKPSAAAAAAANPALDRRADEQVTALARSYRDRLYQNPQSLAEVVRISAVRQDGGLLGYRIEPGKERSQFEQLGFRQGDLLTGVNGIPLDDPANTMRLYQTMRSASEAVFELERDGQPISLTVSLAEETP